MFWYFYGSLILGIIGLLEIVGIGFILIKGMGKESSLNSPRFSKEVINQAAQKGLLSPITESEQSEEDDSIMQWYKQK
jgi:hypothetical protein